MRLIDHIRSRMKADLDRRQDFVGQMRRVLDAWQREPVQAEAVAEAHRDAERHLARRQAENGIVPG